MTLVWLKHLLPELSGAKWKLLFSVKIVSSHFLWLGAPLTLSRGPCWVSFFIQRCCLLWGSSCEVRTMTKKQFLRFCVAICSRLTVARARLCSVSLVLALSWKHFLTQPIPKLYIKLFFATKHLPSTPELHRQEAPNNVGGRNSMYQIPATVAMEQ